MTLSIHVVHQPSADPADYTDRLATEIVPELITQAAFEMGTADLTRATALLKTTVIS